LVRYGSNSYIPSVFDGVRSTSVSAHIPCCWQKTENGNIRGTLLLTATVTTDTDHAVQVFALPISYTLSVIIALLIYKTGSTNYLSQEDDDSSGTVDNVGGNCYILYVIAVTVIVFYCQVHFVNTGLLVDKI
jgi:hypothetical protein